MVGFPLFTTTVTLAVIGEYVVSVGVKVTVNVLVPAASIAPTAGLYANDPGTDAVAFNCVDDNAVPFAIADGVVQVIAGAALFTTRLAETFCVE